MANVDNDPSTSPEFAPDSVVGCGDDEGNDGDIAAVSYTHLTLPTNREV